jgi:hypothetical protein
MIGADETCNDNNEIRILWYQDGPVGPVGANGANGANEADGAYEAHEAHEAYEAHEAHEAHEADGADGPTRLTAPALQGPWVFPQPVPLRLGAIVCSIEP